MSSWTVYTTHLSAAPFGELRRPAPALITVHGEDRGPNLRNHNRHATWRPVTCRGSYSSLDPMCDYPRWGETGRSPRGCQGVCRHSRLQHRMGSFLSQSAWSLPESRFLACWRVLEPFIIRPLSVCTEINECNIDYELISALLCISSSYDHCFFDTFTIAYAPTGKTRPEPITI